VRICAVFEQQRFLVLAQLEACCGMPKLELGDLKSIEQLKNTNIPALLKLVEQGYDIAAHSILHPDVQAGALLLFPQDSRQRIKRPCSILEFRLRHKQGLLRTDHRQAGQGELSRSSSAGEHRPENPMYLCSARRSDGIEAAGHNTPMG
jgi:hypothetical protein